MENALPVLLVFHDAEDDWQFLSSYEESASECVLVHLSHLLNRDETLHDISDLPVGWKAWRGNLSDTWTREVVSEEQGHVE